MDEVDPELVKTFNKLGISLEEIAEASCGSGGRCGARLGEREDHTPGTARRTGRDFLLLLRRL